MDFFYYGMEGLTESQQLAMGEFWGDFHFLRSEPLPRPKFARCWGIDDWCPESVCDAVSSLHAREHYDVVLVNYVWMSKILTRLEKTIRIIDTHDVFGDRHLISKRIGLEPRWFFTTNAEEDIGFSRADLLIGIQEHESSGIRKRVSKRVVTVGHLMSPRFLYLPENPKPPCQFGYFGSGNPWNVKCVKELDDALSKSRNVDWALAGSISRSRLRLKSNPYLIGAVEQPSDFYNLVDCVVNPMIGGTGLKIKTVEAVSYGKPVIGTREAFLGLPIEHGAHKLETVAECAECMVAFSRDMKLQSELRQASRVLCIEYISKVSTELDELYSLFG